MNVLLLTVKERIDKLTPDEDHRQDLWVHYLENKDPDGLLDFLSILQINQKYNKNKDLIGHNILLNGISNEFLNFFLPLLELEQHIVCLLIIGMSVDEIVTITKLEKVQVDNLINTFKINKDVKRLRNIYAKA